MLLGLLGDVHGDFDAIERAAASEPGVVAWLSVGDIGSETGAYPAPSRPFFFIKGNNEDFDVIARLAAGEGVAPNLHLIPNGQAVLVEGVRVAGLGGTFAPKWYDSRPEDLPDGRRAGLQADRGAALEANRRAGLQADRGAALQANRRAGLQARRRGGPSGPPARDDKRRHFVRSEVEACMALTGVDLFLSHEAPRPYWVGTGRGRNDAGKTVINEIVASMRPRLHVFGHHHTRSERAVEGIASVGLPLAGEGYLLLETEAWSWTFRDFTI